MELAQVNIGVPHEPIGSVRLQPFVDLLDEVNALADRSPGFRWRLQTEDGNATAVKGFAGDDDGTGRLIINMSVWASFEDLAAFVYEGRHLVVMRRRREWFERMATSYMALWWVPDGHRPTVAEAEDRLAALRAEGPSPYAFSFREHFPPPDDQPAAAAEADDRWGCPTG